MIKQHTFPRSLAGFLALLSVTACSGETPPPPKPKPVIAKTTGPGEYVTDLALAKLSLTKNQDVTDVKPYLPTLNGYTEEKKKKKAGAPLTVLVLEYDLADRKQQKLILPQQDSTGLTESLKKLSGLQYTLHNMHVFRVDKPPVPETKFSKDDPVVLRQQIEEEQQRIMGSAREIPVAENVRIQLELVRFFMREHAKDAAYLAMENAKDMLAGMAEKKTDPSGEVQSLSKETEELENSLHRQMPYKL